MKYRKRNITIPAFFLLLIFVLPFVIKAGHNHITDPLSSTHSFSGKLISKEIRCHVCNFEFVTFDTPGLSVYFNFLRACTIDLTITKEKVFRNFLTYFSLRAPPQF